MSDIKKVERLPGAVVPSHGGLTGKDFKYKGHADTDISKTFKRARAAQAAALTSNKTVARVVKLQKQVR